MTHPGSGAKRWGWRAARGGLAIGLERAREAAGPIAWVSLAAGLAYLLAGQLLGHAYPFFAAVAAFSALGFSPDVQPRRVGEVAFGISLGVAIGELIQLQFGSGALQTALVMFVAAMIARVLDPSPVLTIQSAVQATVVLGLPAMAASGGPVGRWTDALIGGCVALVFSLFVPKDPRRRPRRLARVSLHQLAEVLGLLGVGLAAPDPEVTEEALGRARRTQAGIAAWDEAVAASRATARVSPTWRRHAADLARLADACEFADRAIRGVRVLARRASVAVDDGFSDPRIGGLIVDLGESVRLLGDLLASGADTAQVMPRLRRIAGELALRGERDPVRHTLISLLRSATLDVMRTAGADHRTALDALAS